MFPNRQRILLLRLAGDVIRTTADHPFYVAGQGWTAASDRAAWGWAAVFSTISAARLR